MTKYLLVFIFLLVSISGKTQNRIAVRGGATFTRTAVSEYNRGLSYFYYDSVSLDTEVVFPSFNIDADISLGKGWFFASGLSYMRKGIESVQYVNGGFTREARQEYMGLSVMLKYHHRLDNGRVGLYIAGGVRADFTVGGPNNAEIAYGSGSNYFHAFGTFSIAEFVLPTQIGASYRMGPGEILLDLNFLKGLSDVLPDRYIVGRSFSVGLNLGYALYLSKTKD
jgi:hypothetical protein